MNWLSRILKSSQVIIDSKKYFLKEEVINFDEIEEEAEKIDAKIGDVVEETVEETLEDFIKAKEHILEEAKVEHDAIIGQATGERDAIISVAYEEAMSMKETSKIKGFEEGKNEGLESIYEYQEKVTNEMLTEKSDMLEKYKEYFKSREETMIDLIIDSIEKILHIRLEDDKVDIGNLVKNGIESAILSKSIVIRVSEEDYENALGTKKKLLAFSHDIETIEYKIDESLQKGDSIIETPNGNIDVGVTTQFKRLEAIFRDLLSEWY